jgi:hypothetical protein
MVSVSSRLSGAVRSWFVFFFELFLGSQGLFEFFGREVVVSGVG